MSTSTRDRILDAAADVMTRVGLARTTTKEIAKACGCSEALLYKHFRDKEEIFLGVLSTRLPRLPAVLAALPDRAGTGSVEETLVEVIDLAVAFYAGGFAIGSSILGDPALLERHGAWLRERGAGPHKANEMLAAYLKAEQDKGRVGDVDPDAAAALLLGAAYQRAFFHRLVGTDTPRPRESTFAQSVVNAALRGLTP